MRMQRGMENPKPQDFIERNNMKGFTALIFDWGVIFGTIAFSVWANDWIVYLISVWIIGAFQYAIAESLFHEASHYNLFKTKKLNDYLEWVYAVPFFVDMTQYRKEHTDHHFKMNTEVDHIMRDYEYQGLNKPKKNMFWIWFIKPFTGYAGFFYFRFSVNLNPLKSSIKFAIFWLPAISIFWYFDALHLLALYWFVPFVWSFPIFFYWAEISEHYNTKSGARTDIGFLKNLFHHNSGYHYIHHKYPSIPWYKLPEAHKALCQGNSDVVCGFLDTYRSLKKSDVRM